MNISIVTNTKLQTEKLLLILLKIIENQTYKNICEWIIVETSNTDEECILSNMIVDTITCNITSNIMIRYIKKNQDYIKNGDIIITMEPDEYYESNHIEKLVKNFNNTNIVYTNNIYIYDIILSKSFKTTIEPFSSMIAYHKSFINKPLPAKIIDDITIIKIVDGNSILRKTIIGCSLGMQLDGIIPYDITIPELYYDLYKDFFILNETLPHDIVYFTGGHSIQWDPSSMSLGGSEQAVVMLSEAWVRMGKRVIVYGNFIEEKIVNNITYRYWYNFPYEKKIKTLIVWRHCGIVLMLEFLVHSNISNLIVDFHDNFIYTLNQLDRNKLTLFLESCNHINVKSNYHKECLLEFIKLSNTNINVIMNGVRKESFIVNNNYIRNPYRFCYCSSYDRGLEIILTKIWPHIYRMNNRAELHIYYGMEHLNNISKDKLKLLMGQEGVMDHGRQPLDIIVREKYMSTFHLYLNNCIAEIDCISIRESLVTGCIPIISDFGVFKERHGLQYNFNPSSDIMLENIASDIVGKMNNSTFINSAQAALTKSDTIIDWDQIAKLWSV